MACLWNYISGFCRQVWWVAWLSIIIYYGLDASLPYVIRRIFSRTEKPKRISKEWNATTPSVGALPRPLMVLSHIQIQMWFVRYTASLIYWSQLIYHVSAISLNNAFNKGVPWLLMNVLWFLKKRPPDLFLEVNDMVIIKRRAPQSKLRHLFKLLVYLVLFTGCVVNAHADPRHEETKTHVAAMKDIIETSEQVLSACVASHSLQDSNQTPHSMGAWDSDAFPIIIDSATTRTITPCFSDLIDPIPFNASLIGLGKGSITHPGKIKWYVLDEIGHHVVIEDDDGYFSEQAPCRLLCPHSWKKHQDDKRYEK
jgi:hypothetical protein